MLVCRYDRRAMVILEPDREWVFSADPLGRMIWVHTPETTYRRSRYDRWYRRRRGRWAFLEPMEPGDVEAMAAGWRPVWKRARRRASGPFRRWLEIWIERFFDFHREDAERFRLIYPHIPILPPDAYQSLYIQLSQGCPWNRCHFCSFYRDRTYRVFEIDDLKRHLSAARAYWEGALDSRSAMFLGDANATAIPTEALLERLRIVREIFPEEPLGVFDSFSDFFSAPRRAHQDFARLHEMGLRRICFGVESGDAELLARIEKPFHQDDVVRAVHRARQGGLLVSLIFMVGLGGRTYRNSHFESSLKLVSSLSLKRPHRIYLSPLLLDPALPYVETETHQGWGVLSDEEIDSEMNRWREALSNIAPRLPVSPYNIRLFAY